MSSVFVIQNQRGQFLSRQKEWVEKTEIAALYKTPHRDLAINELFEVTSKDTDTRAKVVEAQTSEKGLPLVAELPPLEFAKVALPEDMAWMDSDGEQKAASPAVAEVDGDEPADETDSGAESAGELSQEETSGGGAVDPESLSEALPTEA